MMMESSPSRVSRIPELVSFICRFATPHTRGSLLRVSRSYFNITAPIVWESVRGVHNLLRLIPGVSIDPPNDLYFQYKAPNTITIALPPVLNLDRFNSYAPYVQKLEIYTSNGDSIFYDQITLSNWTLLSKHSQRYTLLPNLSQLTLTSPCGRADETELFIWAMTFMSPGLTTLRVSPDTSVCQHLSLSFASTLARHAKSTCPNLHTLSLVSSGVERTRTWSSKSTQLSSAFAIWEPSYYQCISTMPLRELCCGAGILLPSNICLVGQLACLERLELYCRSESLNQSPAQLGPEFLPLLNELSLVAMYWSDITSVLEMDIYSRVKSLSIRILGLDQEVELSDDESSIDLEPIVLYTPALIKLQIDFGGSFAPRDAAALQVLDALSLQDLTLVNVSLSHGALEKLPLIFPLAHTIRIPQCELNLEDLQCFSQSSELVHLAVDLSILPPGSRSPLQPSSGSQVASKFRTLEINALSTTTMMVDLSPLARYLLSIWPNLQQVVQTSNSYWPYEGYVDFEGNDIITNALNALISAYRTISNLSK